MDPIRAKIERWFSKLREGGFEVTSPDNPAYNCAAFAVDDTGRWWEPVNPDGYWPPGVPLDTSVASYAAAFGTAGFELCESPSLEAGYEKITIYAEDGEFVHAARQLPSGAWVSKLGRAEDIQHQRLSQLEGTGRTEYGSVVAYMRRRR